MSEHVDALEWFTIWWPEMETYTCYSGRSIEIYNIGYYCNDYDTYGKWGSCQTWMASKWLCLAWQQVHSLYALKCLLNRVSPEGEKLLSKSMMLVRVISLAHFCSCQASHWNYAAWPALPASPVCPPRETVSASCLGTSSSSLHWRHRKVRPGHAGRRTSRLSQRLCLEQSQMGYCLFVRLPWGTSPY